MLPTPYGFQQKTIEKLTKVAQTEGACFVFDETGLGKTIIGAHLATNLSEGGKVLVVSPKTNIANWQKLLPNADVVTKQKVTQQPYDVVVVDEAHAYKNTKGKLYDLLFKTIWLGNPSRFPYVVLLSATPYNNTVDEFAALFTLCPFKTEGVAFHTLGEMLISAHRCETEMKKALLKIKLTGSQHINLYMEVFNAKRELISRLQNIGYLLSHLSSRNTRQDIPEYSHRFPKTKRLEPIKFKFNSDVNSLIWATIRELERCTFEGYQPEDSDLPAEIFESATVAGFLRTFLFKRLDSSARAFLSSLYKIKNGCPSDSPDVKIISGLCDQWERLKDSYDSDKAAQALQSINGNEGKSIIFTEYIETAEMLDAYMRTNFNGGVVYFNAKKMNDEDAMFELASEFDANFEGKQTNKYKLLIATDALAEGANLHRATMLLHYDLKWNPSKIIQREGRINRLFKESLNPTEVYIASFATDSDIENKIALEDKIETKQSYADSLFEGFKSNPVLNEYKGFVTPSGVYIRYDKNFVQICDAPYEVKSRGWKFLKWDRGYKGFRKYIGIVDILGKDKKAREVPTFVACNPLYNAKILGDGFKDLIEAIELKYPSEDDELFCRETTDKIARFEGEVSEKDMVDYVERFHRGDMY
jgi:superfamily II DNA or RNA helicase